MRAFLTACSVLSYACLSAVQVFASEPANLPQPPKVGDDAPDFEMAGSDGKTYKLSDFKGKQAVVVAWFPKAFTPGCTNECKSFRSDGEAMRDYNVAYFTASCDTQDYNAKFAKSLGLDYPILCDPSRKTALAYGLVTSDKGWAKRYTFYIGENGKLLHIDKKVATSTHGADVAAKLGELGVAKKK